MYDIKKGQALVLLGGLIAFLIVIDSQCYEMKDACLPDFGSFVSAPNVVSDQTWLLDGLAHGKINAEWKEKPGEVYGVIASNFFTGNYHTFSIISSAALMVVTFFLSYEITKNRLASILAVMVLTMSRTFLWYSDSIPYPDYWCTLFFLSLYPFKQKILKPVSFVASFVMKAQALAFLPLLFVNDKSKRNRLIYIGIGVVTAAVALVLKWARFSGQFNIGNLQPPYVVFEILLQDFWVICLFFPVAYLTFHLWRKQVSWAGTLLGGMLWSLFFQYVLALFTTYGAFSERMLPFIVFFALSCGLVISKKEMFIKWKPKTAYQKEAYLYVSG